MKRKILAGIGICVGLIGSLTAPQRSFAQAPADATTVVNRGRCAVFKVGENEYPCEKTIYSFYPKSSRQSYLMDIPDGLLSVSGVRANVVTPSSFTLYVDSVTLLMDNGKYVKKHDAGGACAVKLSADRVTLQDLRCEAHAEIGKVVVQFEGDGKPGKTLQSESIVAGIEMFNKAYKSIGMLGVIRQIKECYSKLKYGGDIEPLAFCFGMDYTAFNIDEAMSEKLGMKQNVYTRRANMMERAQTGLKKFGYDADGRDRQISAWIKRVEQWLKE